MIGAMPAVAVRHERRKQEKRSKRPSMLQLHRGDGERDRERERERDRERSSGGAAADRTGGSVGGGGSGSEGPGGRELRHPSPPSRASSPGPSPLASPPSHHDDLSALAPQEFYVCGKVSVLHLVVVSLLLGAILLIVGLVQLKPGADASDHRYYLLAAGGVLMAVGLALTGLRCWLLPPGAGRGRHAVARHCAAGDAARHEGGARRHTHAVTAAAHALQQRLRKEDSQVAHLTAAGDGRGSCDEPDCALDAVLVNDCAEVFTPTLESEEAAGPRLVTSDGAAPDAVAPDAAPEASAAAQEEAAAGEEAGAGVPNGPSALAPLPPAAPDT